MPASMYHANVQKAAKSNIPLVRATDAATHALVAERIAIYDRLRRPASSSSFTAGQTVTVPARPANQQHRSRDHHLTVAPSDPAAGSAHNPSSTTPPPSAGSSASSANSLSDSDSSAGLSPITPTSTSGPCAPAGPTSAPASHACFPASTAAPANPPPPPAGLSPETLQAWANAPWYGTSEAHNDAALRQFIKQPVSAEMVAYLACRTEAILPMPGPSPSADPASLADSPPWPPLRHFIATVVSKAEVRTGTLMATLVYLDRFRSIIGPSIRPDAGVAAQHRVFFACLILTCKYLHDSNLKNRCWARCSVVSDWLVPGPDGLPTPFAIRSHDVNLMENEMLSRLEWRLAITPADLHSQLDYFLAPIRATIPAPPVILSPAPTATASPTRAAVPHLPPPVAMSAPDSRRASPPPRQPRHRPSFTNIALRSVPSADSLRPPSSAADWLAPSAVNMHPIPERTPSLSPPGLIPSSRRSAHPHAHLATPLSLAAAPTPTSASAGKRRSLLHCRSLVSLSAISPIGKTRKSASNAALNATYVARGSAGAVPSADSRRASRHIQALSVASSGRPASAWMRPGTGQGESEAGMKIVEESLPVPDYLGGRGPPLPSPTPGEVPSAGKAGSRMSSFWARLIPGRG